MNIRNIKAIELSEKTGISKSSLSEYIKGKYEAKQKGIYKLAKVLNVSEGWLMGLDVPMERQLQENKDKKNTDFHDEEYHGLNTEGLTDEDIEDIKAYIEMRRNINKSKNKQ